MARAVGPALEIMRRLNVRIDGQKLRELAEKHGTDNSK
jgi:hypothetical protein